MDVIKIHIVITEDFKPSLNKDYYYYVTGQDHKAGIRVDFHCRVIFTCVRT